MTRNPFTPAAQRLWDAIPPAAQKDLLANVWCGNCRSSQHIADFTAVAEEGDIRLQGFCDQCGRVVVRIIETSEAPPPP